MIISINGAPGSGKSTIAKKLAKKLGWPSFDMGEIRRLKAKSLGITLSEYNKMGENNPKTDIDVDKYQKQLPKKYKNFVIQGRVSWHFLPHSIKIYLDVDEDIGAERVFKELQGKNYRNEDRGLKTVEDVLFSHRKRKKSDAKRYKKYYNITITNKDSYDYVLDTSKLNKKQVFSSVYQYVKTARAQLTKT